MSASGVVQDWPSLLWPPPPEAVPFSANEFFTKPQTLKPKISKPSNIQWKVKVILALHKKWFVAQWGVDPTLAFEHRPFATQKKKFIWSNDWSSSAIMVFSGRVAYSTSRLTSLTKDQSYQPRLPDEKIKNWLVVSTNLKNMSQNGFIFPNFWDENKTYMSCHHPANV